MSEKTSTPKQTARQRVYKRRVRNILIHKPMQREFILILVALLMVSSLAIGFVIHDTIHEAAFGGGFRFGKINPYEVLSEVRYQIIVKVTCILFVTLIVIGIFAVFFLHRVAGPIYRFRQVFLRINDGEIPNPVKLREGDFFAETASEVNLIIERTKREKDKKEDLLKELKAIQGDGKNPSLSAKIDEVIKIVEK